MTSGPHTYSGKLKEALAELKKVVADLNAGRTIDPAYAKSVIDAAQKGIEEWKTTVSKYFTNGTAPLPPEVQQILNSIEAIKTALNAPKDCLAQNIPTTTSPSGRNTIIRLFPIDACTLSAEQKGVLEGLEEKINENISKIIYDYPAQVEFTGKEFADDDITDSKTELRKNLCGEYLMLEKVAFVGRAVTYYVPPRGKKPISQAFGNDTEFYQYLMLRILNSENLGCANFSLGEDYYLDDKFFQEREKIITFLGLENGNLFGIANWQEYQKQFIEALLEDGSESALAVQRIKERYSNLRARELGELLGNFTIPTGLIVEEGVARPKL